MDLTSCGNGDTYDGSVAFAGGSFHTDRRISLPGVGEMVKSDPSMFLAGGRLRAGYEFAFDWYIGAYGDLDLSTPTCPASRKRATIFTPWMSAAAARPASRCRR
jgi:hypothetical protein